MCVYHSRSFIYDPGFIGFIVGGTRAARQSAHGSARTGGWLSRAGAAVFVFFFFLPSLIDSRSAAYTVNPVWTPQEGSPSRLTPRDARETDETNGLFIITLFFFFFLVAFAQSATSC